MPGPATLGGVGALDAVLVVVVLGTVTVLVLVVPVDVVVVVVVVVVVPVLDVVVVVVVVVVGDDGHDSETVLTPGGKSSVDTATPGGSWKYKVWPFCRTTVTAQSAAAALLGTAAVPATARVPAAAMAKTFSCRRLNKVAPYSLATSPGSDDPRQGTDPRPSTVSRAWAARY